MILPEIYRTPAGWFAKQVYNNSSLSTLPRTLLPKTTTTSRTTTSTNQTPTHITTTTTTTITSKTSFLPFAIPSLTQYPDCAAIQIEDTSSTPPRSRHSHTLSKYSLLLHLSSKPKSTPPRFSEELRSVEIKQIEVVTASLFVTGKVKIV